MQQKASVGRFEVYFGLDLYRFVKDLSAKKRKHSIILPGPGFSRYYKSTTQRSEPENSSDRPAHVC